MDYVTHQSQPGLAEVVGRWDLSRHPFWADWQAGQVPASGMAVLARELDALLPLLQRAWEQVNDEAAGEIAAEQALLWHRFAQGVTGRAELERLTAADELLSRTRHYFLKEHTTLGALYAIQSQLPFIAAKVLDAVERFYANHAEHVMPFCQHVQENNNLAGRALRYLGARSQSDQQGALEAGVREAEGLWNMLTGIHASYSG